jgi:hypothetical protein
MEKTIYIILIILFFLTTLFTIYIIQSISNKKGGNIDKLIEESKNETQKTLNLISNIKNSVSYQDDILLDITNLSETEKMKKFIANNKVTKFIVNKKGKQIEYSLDDLINFLNNGNCPHGIIYTTTKNKYNYNY